MKMNLGKKRKVIHGSNAVAELKHADDEELNLPVAVIHGVSSVLKA